MKTHQDPTYQSLAPIPNFEGRSMLPPPSPFQPEEKAKEEQKEISELPPEQKQLEADTPPIEVEEKRRVNFEDLALLHHPRDWKLLLANLKAQKMESAALISLCAQMLITAKAGDVAQSRLLQNQIIAHLQKAEAFSSAKDKANLWSGVYAEMMDLTSGQDTRSEEGTLVNDNSGFQPGRLVLESSTAGGIFNGVDLSPEWEKISLPFWAELSELYAKGIEGEVHIHLYRGFRKDSVVFTREWPHIEEKINQEKVKVEFFRYANWGKELGHKDGQPVFERRKREGESTVEEMKNNSWQNKDAMERAGGYWPRSARIGSQW